MAIFDSDGGGQSAAEMWGKIVDDFLNERSKFPPSPLLGGQLTDDDFAAAKAELLYKETTISYT